MLAMSDLLAVTLALTLLSFIATLYVIVRTLTPLIRPHILSRHSRPTNPLPVYGYGSNQPEKKKLRSAQRFQCWLAFVDLSSCGVWLWEVVALASGSASSPARMAFAICARPTVLVVVSLLSYFNVIRGKTIELGRFDFIVWIPSLVLLAVLVSLAYISSTSTAIVWQVMMAVQTSLLCVCTWCFGRLLLAVFRVRRDTVRSQVLRHQFVMEEKRAFGPPYGQEQLDDGSQPPLLPPIKTNRWLISKTFLKSKASTAANTVATSFHRRSQSGPYAGRPSTTSEVMPRPSQSSSAGDHNRPEAPYGFLNHDPAVTSRYGHFRHHSTSQAELQPPPMTPRSITFSNEARPNSPAPPDRLGALSRMTDRTRISGDEPRPSMGSYMSTDSNSTDTHGPASYLGAGRLLGNGRNTTLSQREAKKAGARMGGHLVGCVTSWTLILPFLVYKMTQPWTPAPFYTTLLVALGVSLSGPLLAFQTVVAEGFWYKTDLPPLMASSSAVAFEQLESRANTPMYSGNLVPAVTSPTQPNSANTATTNVTGTSSQTHHRSTESNGSSSSVSLASIAAFSNPAPGTFRHSSDTRDRPSGFFAQALSMAAPHPKLQVISRGTGGGGATTQDVESQDENSEWKRKEARKLKSFSMSRESVSKRRSNTITSMTRSRDDLEKGGPDPSVSRRSVLGSKDANALTAQMLAEKKRTPSPSPTISSYSDRSSVHERRRSAPTTPTSSESISEDGVLVKRRSERPIDAMTAALLTSLVPGVKVGQSTIGSTRHSLQKPKVAPTTPESTTSSSRKRRPNLSLDISRKDSHFSKCDTHTAAPVEEVPVLPTAPVKTDGYGEEKRHLRRRSWKSISGAVLPAGESENVAIPVDDIHVTRRRVTPKLSPPRETAGDEEEAEDEACSPAEPRPSLDEDEIERSTIEEDKEEVLSDSTSPGLLSPTSPQALPDTSFLDSMDNDDRPSIILRTKPSSFMLGRDDTDEVGTVSMATRIPRVPSRRSSFSSEFMLRPSSRNSNSSGGSRNRSSTLGSITSEGFRNMIASNRNSWTLSDVGNDSVVTPDVSAVAPLGVRDSNRNEDNTIAGDKSLDKLKRPITPTITYTPPGRNSVSSAHGRPLSDDYGNDENAPLSPTPRRSITRAAELPRTNASSMRSNTRSILSIR